MTRAIVVNQTNIQTVSKATFGETDPERRDGAHMGLPERIDTDYRQGGLVAKASAS